MTDPAAVPETLPPTIGLPLLRFPLDLSADRLRLRVGSMPGAALLEGGPGFGDAGRWSILVAHPVGTFAFDPRDDEELGRGDPLDRLGRWIEELGLQGPLPAELGRETGDDLPPFLGGLIGVFGYDLAPWIERVPRKAACASRMPSVFFRLYDTFVAVDHRSETASLWVVNLLGEPIERVEERGNRWRGWLQDAPERVAKSRFETPLVSNFSAEGYRRAVGRAVEYIHAGDIFQANISQRFEVRGTPVPLDLYRRLRTRSPAPYSALLRLDEERSVISSSPELFYETQGARIVTRPIKGTRPRGISPSEDEAQRADLIASAKDRAELAMIVDLERNDLGRVCAYGSVRVTEPSSIESYATVHHQVATIEGRLREGVGPIDVVRAVFPGGSITGAPKIRAMEIIDELEPTRRSLYTGAIGYYSLGGRSAFNIAIRTMLVEGNRVSYQVGGGIVADSDPQLEYEETLHKGRAMRDVLEARG
ncbi:aminodeoxychorismate synthase component I [Tautonia marina]|uniref:aminodeoxychorismate synthase component I n=1 Tax=Tautonia marina TaxID=2653855 RepID=UPI001F381A33|nr:aminodeoxychorismate synthase component I [Tautonia marina]